MKLRYSLVLVVAAVSFVSCGSKFFIQKDAYATVKKVALVQEVMVSCTHRLALFGNTLDESFV